MKKLALLLVAFLLAVVTVQSVAARDIPITFAQLPAKAQAFIKKHFSEANVASVWKDTDILDQDYKVYLNDGTQIEFYFNGDWEEVKTHANNMPAAIIPSGIAQFVNANYPHTPIYKIQKKLYGYEVELSNGLDLKFNKKGQFLGMDD